MKKRTKGFIVCFLILSMVFQTISSAFIYAQGEVKPNVTVTEFSIVDQKSEYYGYEKVKLALKWDASHYDNTLKEGDYFEVTLPENMTFPTTSEATKFDLLDSDGKVVAKAVVTPGAGGGGKIKATFTSYVKNKYNVKGTMHLEANFSQEKLKFGQVNTFKVVVGNTTKELKAKIKDVIGKPTEQFAKWAEEIPGNSNQVKWSLRINFSAGKLTNLKIEDKLSGNETIIEGSLKLYSISLNNLGQNKGKIEIPNVDFKLSADKKSFTVDLSKVRPHIPESFDEKGNVKSWKLSDKPVGDLTGAQLFITYRTTYTPGTKVTNNAKGISPNWDSPKHLSFQYQSASSGGTGEGNKGKVKIVKVDAVNPNIKLPQAKFEIRVKDTNELVETMITGANGEAISTKTLDPTKKYILKEISTPPGYEVESTSQNLEFTPNANKLTGIDIKNKRILTSVSGEKTWVNDEGYNVRPEQVTIQLVADGVDVQGKTLTVKPDQNGQWKYEFKDLPKYRTDKRDENGKDIPIVYTVREVNVPEGYTSEVTGMNVKNTYKPKEFDFKFRKTDINGTELPGATIKLSSDDGRNLIKENGVKVPSVEWVSDGNAKQLTLEPGSYTLKEENAPEGYTFATTIKFTVKPDGTVEGTNVKVEGSTTIVTMVDDYKYHPVKVSKVDLGGKELAGAKITVKSADGTNLISENGKSVNSVSWESTDTAKELKLRAGKYVFHEEAAPEGYLTVTDIEFEVDKDGNVKVTKVAEDDIVKSEGGKVTITDRKKPTVKTEAKVNDKKEDAPTDKVVLTDVVKYNNLIVGKKYTAKLVWMDKETNKPFMVDGKEVAVEKEFVAEQENGEVELSTTVDAKHFEKDTTLVAFEEVYKDNTLVASHKDINDADQTVKVKQPKPELKTEAKVNGEKEAKAKDELTLTDKVSYKNLVIGKEYTVKLVWMDKETNKPFLVDGKEVTAEKTFVADKSEGEIELSTTIDSKHFTKETKLVAFEKMFENNTEVGAHEDINDADQTVVVKENFNTVKVSKVDLGGKELAGAKITVKSADGTNLINDNGKKVNSISWESTDTSKELNLLPGKYVFHEESAPEGYLTVTDIEFEVDKDGNVKVTKVAEDDIVKSEGGKVTITDRKKPTVKTEAKVNDKKEDAPTDKVVLTDVVKYNNLIVGKKYTAKLVWMDKETNKPFMVDGKEVAVEKEFVAEQENGEVELSTTVDAKHFEKDTTLVAFEEVYKDNTLVASHKDINDADQTVKVKQPKPELKTEAKVNGKKEADLEKTLTLTDYVYYSNLVVGKEYTVKLVWMDKETGKPFLVNGKPLTVEKTFVAEKSKGKIELSVNVEAKDLKGGKLVAFETLYEKGVEIGSHRDINDPAQTISLRKHKLPKTNISSNLYFVKMLLASGVILYLIDSKRKKIEG